MPLSSPSPSPSPSPVSKPCHGVFVQESVDALEFLSQDMLVDDARQRMAAALQQRRSQTGEQVNPQVNPQDWPVHFHPTVLKPSTTRLGDVEAEELKMIFSPTDPEDTHLARLLDETMLNDLVMTEQVRSVSKSVTNLMDTCTGLRRDLDESLKENARLLGRVTFVQETNARLDQSNARLEEANTALLERLTAVEDTNARLDKTNIRLDKTNIRLEEANRRIEERLSKIELEKTALKKDVKKHKEEIKELEERLDGQDTRHSLEIQTLQSQIEQQDAKAQASAAALGTARAKIDELALITVPLCRRILMDATREKIEGLLKKTWTELLSEYTRDQLRTKLGTDASLLSEGAFNLVWVGNKYRKAGNKAAHQADRAMVRESIEAVTQPTHRGAFNSMFRFVYGPDALDTSDSTSTSSSSG